MLHVSLLGEQSITGGGRDGAGIRTRSSRSVALIAFLAAHAGAPQLRQRIAGLFWPDSTDAQALTNLRRELHQLRQVLGDEPSLVVTPVDLCWRDTEHVPRRPARFQHRARGGAGGGGQSATTRRSSLTRPAPSPQYRGDLLPGVYDDWLLDARSELERQCVDLCDLLGESAGRGAVTWPGRWMRPAAGSSCSRWRRSATAP